MTKQSQFEFAVDPMADIRNETAKFAFAIGVRMLVGTGTAEAQARAFLGKRIKEIGKPALIRAIIDAALREAVDPKSFIASAGRAVPGKLTQRAEDDEKNSDGIQPWMT